MPRTSAIATANLPAATQQYVEAMLLEYNADPSKEAKLWTFQYNPESLNFSGEAKYSEQATFASESADLQFSYTPGLQLEIPEIYLDTYCLGKSLKPAIEGLDALRKADIKNSRFAPKVLSFLFGGKRFAPCVLSRLSWKETAWLGGEPARVRLSLTLQQVPKPGRLGLAQIAPELQSKKDDGNLLTPLTDRQKGDASTQAKQWLTANAGKLSQQVQQLVQSNAYKLSTDASTGITTMYQADGKTKIGVVGKWDGKAFATDNINTIPKLDVSTRTQAVTQVLSNVNADDLRSAVSQDDASTDN